MDGTADIDFSTGISFALQAIYASDTRVWAINRSNGTAVAFDHDGTGQSGDNHQWGSGNWRASFVLPDEPGANTAPAFADASYSFDDVAIAVGEIVGTVAATDADNDTLSYTLTGTDASTFAIDANGQITVAVALTNSQVYSFNVVADDGTDTTSVGVSVTAIADTTPALSFGSEAIANQAWEVDTAITSVTLPEATGGTGTITYSLSPTVPAGITFSAGNRRVSGTPTGRFASATFTYTATDGNGATVELTFTIVVTAVAITFASTIANQAWIVGTAVSLTLPTASGGVGAFTYTLTPTLPAGTTFTTGTRVLAGTPTGRFSSATFTYTATDAESVTETQTFTVVVTAPAIVFNPASFSDQMWTVNMAVSLTLPEATGGVGTLTATLTGTLPSGISFTASSRALAGNPSAVFAVATFTYTMTDTESESESISFTIVVAAAAIPEAGYFYDLAELAASEYPDAEIAVAIPNEDGDDVIAKRAPRNIAQALLAIPTLRDAAATYALIQSRLDYADLQHQPTIPTLRNAQQTVNLIRSLLLYEDNADVTDAANVLTAIEAFDSAQEVEARDALNVVSRSGRYKGTELGVASFGVGEIVPRSLVWDGTNFWVIGSSRDRLIRVDPTTGAGTEIGVAGFGVGETFPESLVWDGTNFWVVGRTRGRLIRVDPTTGAGTEIGVAGFGVGETFPRSLVWDGTNFWVVGQTRDRLIRVDPTTGAGTELGAAGFGVGETVPKSLVWDGTNFWVVGQTRDRLIRVDPTTGAGTELGVAGFGVGETFPTSLVWDGTNFGVVGTTRNRLIRVDPTTGAGTEIGVAGFGVGETVPTSLVWDGTNFWVIGSPRNRLIRVDEIVGNSPSDMANLLGVLSALDRDAAREGLGLQGENLTVTAHNNEDAEVEGDIIVAYDGSSFTVAKGSYTPATERDIFVINYG